jgi:RHS repeat-associated protein
LPVTVTGAGNSTTGHLYVAQEPEQFAYDADGNLTNDGRWAYTWDAENRLIGMTVNTAAGPPYQLTFAYDPKGRRFQKTTLTNGISTTINFLYDGWNLVAALNSQSALLQSFVWGSDLSGSPQGAGGVGGLLEMSYYGATTTNCFTAYDGNGNVAALINAADGTLAANYEYGPFGEVIRATGPLARVNPIRFSTKYQDDESDLLYYGYRYYKPSTGSWLSRDPLNSVPGKRARLALLLNLDLDYDVAKSVARSPISLADYLAGNNELIGHFDILGLCVDSPDSGSGTFDSDVILHKIGKHFPPLSGHHSTLTFKVCCPDNAPVLQNISQTGGDDVVDPPPPTQNNNTFPYFVLQGPSGNGPCYSIVLEVPSTTSAQYDLGDEQVQWFIKSIRVHGKCCANCNKNTDFPLPSPPSGPVAAMATF